MSFFGLAGAGALAVLMVWLAMPETRTAHGVVEGEVKPSV
jgi:hypothetical protein